MTRAVILVLLLCAPLAAEHESNFGRVVLKECDLILQGVASAQRTRVMAGYQVDVTVQSVLHGKTDLRSVSLIYTDPTLLKKDEAVRALFALREIAKGGYALVGKPVLTPDGETESDEKRRVCEAFIALESLPENDKRTEEFWSLLLRHVRIGGYSAQNAMVELLYVARDRASTITEKRFEALQQAGRDAGGRLTTQANADLKLALQGMVEARVKDLKYRRIRRGKDRAEKLEATEELATLVEKWPRAFVAADAKLCKAMSDDTQDRTLRDRLAGIATDINNEIKIREAERGAADR